MPVEKLCPFNARLYLLSLQFPFFRDHVSIQELARDERLPGNDLQTDEIWSVWKAVLDEPDEAVVSRCIEARSKALEEETFESEREQYCVSLDHRAFEANYARWAGKPYVNPSEFAALVLGLEPNRLPKSGYSWRGFPQQEKLLFLRDSCQRAQACGLVSQNADLSEWVAWARDAGQVIPEDLERALKESPFRSTLLLEIQSLKHEIARLQKGNGKPLQSKEKKSLLTIVAVLARKHYDYRPGIKSSVPKRITDLCETMGAPLSEDTILKYLREGAESVELDGSS